MQGKCAWSLHPCIFWKVIQNIVDCLNKGKDKKNSVHNLHTIKCFSIKISYFFYTSGNIYAHSSRMFKINGYMLPYRWNHTIHYDDKAGNMPFLVQKLSVDDLNVQFDVSREVLQYQLSTSIDKGLYFICK